MRTSLQSVACSPSRIISKAGAPERVVAQPHHELLDFQVSSVDDR